MLLTTILRRIFRIIACLGHPQPFVLFLILSDKISVMIDWQRLKKFCLCTRSERKNFKRPYRGDQIQGSLIILNFVDLLKKKSSTKPRAYKFSLSISPGLLTSLMALSGYQWQLLSTIVIKSSLSLYCKSGFCFRSSRNSLKAASRISGVSRS